MEVNHFTIAILLGILYLLLRHLTNNQSFLSAPYVGTEPKIVKRMLNIADIKSGDILYDLGSGDGRIVISAALKGSKAVGIEMDPLKVFYSRLFIKLLKLNKSAKIIKGNFFEKNLSKANIVTLFLLHDTNQKLAEKFKKELKKGTRIVSYSFVLEGWKPERIYQSDDSVWGPIYLYKI